MKKQSKILFTFLILIILIFPICVLADGGGGTQPNSTSITDPLNLKGTGMQVLIGRIISAVLGIVGSLALVMFIYGGFMWMTSSGSAEKVTQGKNTLVWATIGLAVIFSAYAVIRFVFERLGVA